MDTKIEFKVGDVVRRINCDCGKVKVGDLNTVETLDEYLLIVTLVGGSGMRYSTDRFELVAVANEVTPESTKTPQEGETWYVAVGGKSRVYKWKVESFTDETVDFDSGYHTERHVTSMVNFVERVEDDE